MKSSIALLIAAAFAALTGAARAQQADSSRGDFFSSPGPALIFQVWDLTPAAYEGGIGIGYVFSPRMFGRLSLELEASSSKNEEQQHSYGYTLVRNSWSIGCGIAPAHVLYREEPFALYCGPLLRGGVSYTKYTEEQRDSAATSSSWSKQSGWSVGGGAFAGIGVALLDRLFLAAEYRIEERYTTYTTTSGRNVASYTHPPSESDAWNTSTSVLVSLSCRL